MKVIMYPHSGAGNRGCEAIVRSTCKLLEGNNFTLFSSAIDEDSSVGLEKLCALVPPITPIKRGSPAHIGAAVQAKLFHDPDAFDRLAFQNIFSHCDSNTLALSIGGDNYCYGEADHIHLVNKYIRKRKAINILWGCSVGQQDLSPALLDDLRGYDFIYARESLTYNLLKEINPNTKLYPDPAFLLDAIQRPLPTEFEENQTVGINISPLVIRNESIPGITYANFKALIEYILQNTPFKIALISHVIWPYNDDRSILHQLFTEYQHTGRLLELYEGNCMEIKGVIARCRFLVCARTHASIAAYSSCVPTLVVGYSVKARGIAQDLFQTDQNYVIPVQSFKKKTDLSNAFIWLLSNEDKIRSHLTNIMPNYQSRILDVKEDIASLSCK